MTAAVIGSVYHGDTFIGGNYRIVGTTKRLGVFTQRRVCLFDRATCRCTQDKISDADGNYQFNNIAYQYRGYFVIEYDWPLERSDPLNADIADMVTPEPMP